MKQASGALLNAIRIDRSSSRAISVQLYMALRETILSGGLRPGERLPATRTLAQEVGVSRTTVIDAVDRLVTEGMVVSRVGAGTYVSETMARQQALTALGDAPDIRPAAPRLSRVLSAGDAAYAPRTRLPHEARAFVTALPALDAFPMGHWARLSARHLRGDRSAVMGYGEPQGLAELRHAIAAHLGALKGIRCTADQIFVTCGAQHAFSLIGRLFLNPGDKVWMENPGALGARNALVSEGADLVPVDVDAQGLVVADGLARAPDFRLAFVTPSHQQPLGHVLSLSRRFELLGAAETAGAMIIEDDYDGEFSHDNAMQPTLYGTDTRGRVLYVGTFSKTLFPSLRLGFVLVPEHMVATFDRMFRLWASGPSSLVQAVVADFICEGHFATHIRMMRLLYKARHDALIEAGRSLPGAIRLRETASGFYTCADLDPGIDEQTVVAQAAERGVVVAPLGKYCLTPAGRSGLVLGFGCAPPEDIVRGIRILRGLPVWR